MATSGTEPLQLELWYSLTKLYAGYFGKLEMTPYLLILWNDILTGTLDVLRRQEYKDFQAWNYEIKSVQNLVSILLTNTTWTAGNGLIQDPSC